MTTSREISEKEPVHRPILGAVACVLTLGALAIMMIGLPRADAPLPALARQAMEAALPAYKTTEVVSAVVYGIRGFDTFGETFLLMAAVVAVIVLTRSREPRRGYFGEEAAGRDEQRKDPDRALSQGERRARTGEEDDESDSGDQAGEGTGDADAGRHHITLGAEQASSPVVRMAVRTVLPFLGVASLYLVIQGYSPGGGFPAGCAALGVVLLVYAAAGYRAVEPVVRPQTLEVGELIGAAAVIAVFALGLPLAGSVSANWVPLAPEKTLRSGGIVQVFSLLELVEVATGLTIAVFSLVSMRHEWAPDQEEMPSS